MKSTYLIIIIFLVSTFFPSKAQDVLSISKCYELARQNYPQIHQYGLINQTEHYKLSNISKHWLPQFSVNAQASYQSEVTKLPFNEKQFTALMPEANIPSISKDQYRMTAQISQIIWDGGHTKANKLLTRAEAKAERETLESELYTIRRRINELYFGCLLQEELIELNKLLQKDLITNLERIKVLIKNGMANQSDLESVQVELLGAKQKEIELKAGEQAFRRMLGTFINRPVSENTLLSLPRLPQPSQQPIVNRPELHALEAQSEIWNNRQRKITAGLMPQLSAFVQGGFGRPALNMLSNDFEGFYVAGVRLSWNLGKLYTLKNERREIESNRKKIDRKKETFLFNTKLQLMLQDAEIEKINNLIKSDEEIVRLRNRIKKTAEVKLENGVISITDLVREINAEDAARQKASIHHIQLIMEHFNRLYTTNQF